MTSDFTAIYESLATDADINKLSNPLSAPEACAHFSTAAATLATSDLEFNLDEINTLQLKNIFDFGAADLAYSWSKGAASLNAEGGLNEYLAEHY